MFYLGNFNSVVRDNYKLIIGLGAGVVIGTCVTAFYHRLNRNLNRDLANLVANIETLRRDVEHLRQSLDSKIIDDDGRTRKRKRKADDYYSADASSGEDECYEEAYGGSGYESARDTISSEELRPSLARSVCLANSTTALFDQVDKLLEGNDHDRLQAFSDLDSRKEQYQKDADFLWRYSKASFLRSQQEGAKGNEEKKKKLIYQSNQHATKALQLNPHNSSVHKWCAITLGGVGDYETTQVRIKNGWKFKEHIQKAIELDPRDPSAHYLLGRWCFGVYMLTWMEKQVAATFFATPPSATVDEALDHFLQADTLDKGIWKENMLFIAKCYVEKRDYYTAVTWLDKASNAPTNTTDDKLSQNEIESLLYKYGSYRR